ncbi:MAG: tetratricopeptide repeat protein, partial [Thiofilum sp.]
MKLILIPVVVWSSLVWVQAGYALGDKVIEQSPCSFINTGTVASTAQIKLDCAGLSAEAVRNLEKLIQEFAQSLTANLDEQTRSLKQKNDHIELLQAELVRVKAAQAQALADNAKDIKNTPDEPLLVAEREALEVFDFKRAAELRDEYYLKRRAVYREELVKQQAQMAEEAFIAGQRWENAPNVVNALKRYQEAVEFKPDYVEAWLKVSRMAERAGNYSLALKAAQSMQQYLDPEKDKWTLAVALSDEAGILMAFGETSTALAKYKQAQSFMLELATASPTNFDIQRELSVSYEKVGNIQQAKGEQEAALRSYQQSLAIREKLAAHDPQQVEWQRDLSVSYDNVGAIQQAKGEYEAALRSYQQSLAIAEKLAAHDPQQVEWQRDLSVSYDKVGAIQQAKGEYEAALRSYQQS